MMFDVILFMYMLAAVGALSATLNTDSRDDDSFHVIRHANRDNINRDLAVLIRPPWNNDPGSPEAAECVEPNTFFDSDVVVTLEGDSSKLDAVTYSDLEDAFLDAYNTIRRKFCDADSRVVTDVTVDQSSLSTSPLMGEFSLRFVVNVGCDRCSMDTTLFTPEPDGNRRKRMVESNDDESRDLLIYRRPYNVRGASPPSAQPVAPTPAPVVAVAAPPQLDTTLRTEEECCPPNGEVRAPYASEFVSAFDSTYKALAIGNEDPIQSILEAVEIASVSCEEPLEEFDADVFVELSGSPQDVTDLEFAALEGSFQKSYNTLGENLCDPLFRTVVQVTAELEDANVVRHLDDTDGGDERMLQRRRRGRFAYRVRAKCRGCRRNPRLFAQGVSGRNLLEMKYDRQLQFVFDQDTCYCAVDVDERGIFEDEFARAYDASIQVLNEEGILENIDSVEGVEEEQIFTWSPTTSPTFNPTAPTDSPVPSPSPSEEPT